MTSNGVFSIIFFGSIGLLLGIFILRATHAFRRIIRGIAAQYVRDGRKAWAENALLAGLQFGLITLRERNDMANVLDISLAPVVGAGDLLEEYKRKELSADELNAVQKKVFMIRRMECSSQVKVLFTLIAENMKLTAEVNDHRRERGYKILEIH